MHENGVADDYCMTSGKTGMARGRHEGMRWYEATIYNINQPVPPVCSMSAICLRLLRTPSPWAKDSYGICKGAWVLISFNALREKF